MPNSFCSCLGRACVRLPGHKKAPRRDCRGCTYDAVVYAEMVRADLYGTHMTQQARAAAPMRSKVQPDARHDSGLPSSQALLATASPSLPAARLRPVCVAPVLRGDALCALLTEPLSHLPAPSTVGDICKPLADLLGALCGLKGTLLSFASPIASLACTATCRNAVACIGLVQQT